MITFLQTRFKRWLILSLCFHLIACEKAVFVEAPLGTVQGKSSGQIDRFLGIPFAEPPTGENRWRAPLPASPWEGVFDATRTKPACPQQSTVTPDFVTSEDCLHLNIIRPSEHASGRLRPVVVWIYGSNFIIGSNNDAHYDPTEMVRFGDIVFVSINYRLGLLGNLALPELSAETPNGGSGNFFLLDQRQALQWIQENIESFGGDPGNVTLMGESGGAASACWQLASPLSRGLFHRVIMQSGPCNWEIEPIAEAEQRGIQLATAAGCTTDRANCLRALPPKTLHQIAQSVEGRLTPFTGKLPVKNPVFDNVFFTEQPLTALRAGSQANIPVLTGVNLNEGTIFTFMNSPPTTRDQYRALLDQIYDDRAQEVFDRYPVTDSTNPVMAFSEIKGDTRFVCLALESADAMVAGGHAVYFYHFTHPPKGLFSSLNPMLEQLGLALGVYHGAEAPYVFGRSTILGSVEGEDIELSDQMMRYWRSFIHTGSPNHPIADQHDPLPEWPTYSPDERRYIEFKRNPELKSDLKRELCEFWRGI